MQRLRAGYLAEVSTPALALLRHYGFGVDLESAISRGPMRMAAYSLVDDTDLPQASRSQDLQEVVRLLQDAIDA